MDFLYTHKPGRYGFPQRDRLTPIRVALVAILALVVLFLAGSCTAWMVNDYNQAVERCEAAGGFWESDDSECEFPGGD